MKPKEIRRALVALNRMPYTSSFDTQKNVQMIKEATKEFSFSPWFVDFVKKQELIHKYYDFIGLSEEGRKEDWKKRYEPRWARVSYNYMPKAPRKDNGNVRNVGSGGGGYNSVRVPSKKRSNRVWKKFYKLFPHMDPKNKTTE